MGKYVTVGPRSGELATPDPRIKEVALRLASNDGVWDQDPKALALLRAIAEGTDHDGFSPSDHETIHMWAAIFGMTTIEFCRQAIEVLEDAGYPL